MLQAGVTQTYIDGCGKMRKELKTNREYYVYFTYQKNGLIDTIYVHYDINVDLTTIQQLHRSDFL